MKGGNPRLARAFAAAAVVAGLAAAWLVSEYTGAVARRGGQPMEVFAAASPIARGEAITSDAVRVRSVPKSFAPPDAVESLDALEGARAATDIGRGAYLTAPLLVTGSAAGAGYRLRRNERAVTIAAKVAPDGAEVQSGEKVDVFASGTAEGSNTALLLGGAEVLAAAQSTSGESAWRLTLRVADTQVAPLIKGDVFAKELRTVVRP